MIDWTRITNLRDEIGADDFDEVVELFLDEVHIVIEKLRSAPDLGALEADFHFLKGSALNLGFTTFSEKCHNSERQAAQGLMAQINLKDILDCYDHSKAQFAQELPNRFAA